jgi:hypothetical protein
MRRIDLLVSSAMWAIIAISVPIMLMLASDQPLRSTWQYTFALCLLWLPPALSLGQLEDGLHPQPPWFYCFAILALVWCVGLAAYGVFVFDPNT